MTQATKLKNVKWRKVTAPAVWYPKDGDELVGYYSGRTKRDGSYGQYEVVIVLVPYKGTYTVSGTALIQLADAAMLTRGDAVRIKFLGRKPLEEGHEMKLFELYVGEVETAEDMPEEAPVPS